MPNGYGNCWVFDMSWQHLRDSRFGLFGHSSRMNVEMEVV